MTNIRDASYRFAEAIVSMRGKRKPDSTDLAFAYRQGFDDAIQEVGNILAEMIRKEIYESQ